MFFSEDGRGEATASFAHELNQPLAAIANNANACLGLLTGGHHELGEVRDALADIVTDAERASAIIERVRALAKRSAPEHVEVRLTDVVADVLTLAGAEALARPIIEAHGGRLWAESKCDRGAVFSFRLPAAEASAAA